MKIYCVLVLLVLLFFSPIQGSRFRKKPTASPYKSKVFSIPLRREEVPPETKARFFQILQRTHRQLIEDDVPGNRGSVFLQKKARYSSNKHELKLSN